MRLPGLMIPGDNAIMRPVPALSVPFVATPIFVTLVVVIRVFITFFSSPEFTYSTLLPFGGCASKNSRQGKNRPREWKASVGRPSGRSNYYKGDFVYNYEQ